MNNQSFLDSLLISDTNALGLADIFFSLLVPFLLILPVALFYKKFATRALAGQGFITSLLIFAPMTSAITLLIGSNIARAFGLVAALSIIRFRTALKSSMDSIYMFWSLTIGMACGAGYYLAALLVVIMGLIFAWLAHFFKIEEFKFTSIIVKFRVPKDRSDDLEDELRSIIKNPKKINTRYNSSEKFKEVIYTGEIATSVDPVSLESELKKIKDVDKVELMNSESLLF